MSKNEFSEEAVVDIADARFKLRSRKTKSSASLKNDLQEISLLLDKGLSVEARSRIAKIISTPRIAPDDLAEARLALSIALEMHGDYRMSLQAVAMYEADDARADLKPDLGLKLRIQVSLAYDYCGDHPKAIGMLKAALRDLPDEYSAGMVYAALARAYRRISEYAIARDYSQQALDLYRKSGDWRGLAEAYFGIALSDHSEGQHEPALEKFEQALKLIGDHPATFLLGKIYSNMAGVCFNLKRPHEGISYLEKAVDYYEHSDHQMMAAIAYNNLGINLTLVGQWDRAQEVLQHALDLIVQVNEHDEKISMALDSLGELCMLRGRSGRSKELPGARRSPLE